MVALTTRIIYPSTLLFLQEVKLMRKIKVEKKQKKQKKAEERKEEFFGGITFEGDFAQDFFKKEIEEDKLKLDPPSKEHIHVEPYFARHVLKCFNDFDEQVKNVAKAHKLKLFEHVNLDKVRDWISNHIEFFEKSLLEADSICSSKCESEYTNSCLKCDTAHHHSFRQNRKSNKKIFNIAYAHLKAEEEGRGCRLKDPTKCKACSYVVQLHHHNNTFNPIGDLIKEKKKIFTALYNMENPYQDIISKMFEMRKKRIVHYYQGEAHILKNTLDDIADFKEEMSDIKEVMVEAKLRNLLDAKEGELFWWVYRCLGETGDFYHLNYLFQEIDKFLRSKLEGYVEVYPEYKSHESIFD